MARSNDSRQRSTLRRVQEISTKLLSQLDLDPLLESLATGVIDFLKADYGGIYRYFPERDELDPVIHVRLRQESLFAIKPGEGMAGKVFQSGTALKVDDYDKWPGRNPRHPKGVSGAVVQAPLKKGKQILGVIFAERAPGKAVFSAEDLEELEIFASLAAIAIANAELYQEAKRAANEQASLYETALDISGQMAVSEVLQRIIERAKTLIRGHYGQFYQYIKTENALQAAFTDDLAGELSGRMQVGEGLSGKVFSTRKPMIIDDYDSWEGRAPNTPKGLFTRTIGVPVQHANKILGVLAISRGGQDVPFNQNDLRLLTLFANQGAVALANAQQYEELQKLYSQVSEKNRLESELKVAQELQASLLPRELPKVRGWEFAALWSAARTISGDFYDVFPIPGGKWGFVIADVAGKGMPAALFMALCRTLARTLCMDGRPPQAAITRVNDLILADSFSEWFVTLFYGVLDPTWGILTYVNAGHTQPLLYRAARKRVEPLTAKGMALGVEPSIELEERSVQLAPGDMLLMYTDGMSEAEDVDRNFFGERRIRARLKMLGNESAAAMLDGLQKSILAFSRGRSASDDATAIAIKRKP